ncbi:activity-dependent neuroprotector homeobox protein 2 [Oryzias latipes]|uniref:ADNP homeobox 2b n=1 Tax=Oryzias latipes TaxID=8090 RepID=H2MAS0_ORYLA|nr:activity-dependent neuroprotector homeobox protein 2 [Oryzias latipes]XP_023815930.1 activity-dependent neuroprotector homeobox protein 2 [Oryzias latipes]
MFQLPVGNIEKIRKARKAVKNILSEIGLEDCQTFLKDLDGNAEDNVGAEEAFKETDWEDVSEGYNSRQRKKWPYRSRSLCCNLCKYSSQNIYNFRSHVSRCHGYVQSFCALASCSQCLFIGHPKAVKKHMLFFHSKLPIANVQQKESPKTIFRGNERYQCRKCAFPSSSIFAIKKHIILKHLDRLAEKYIGYRVHQQLTGSVKIYCCKVCQVNTGTLDQMLHHMLVEPAHYAVSTQVQSLMYENKNYNIKPTPNGNGLFVTFPNIVPKQQQPQVINSNSLILPSNGQPAGTVVALQPVQGTTNSTTLICTPGNNQTFLPPQASALVQLASAEAKGLLQPGATIALRGPVPQASPVVLPNVTLNAAPVNLPPATAQPQQTLQGQQIVLPSGLQGTVAGTGPRIGSGTGTLSGGLTGTGSLTGLGSLTVSSTGNFTGTGVPSGSLTGTGSLTGIAKPAAVTQNAPTNHINLQGTMLTSQSLLSHLIPTGNKVNGMPTYTFAPLQAAGPTSQRTTPLKPVGQTSNFAPQTKKWITCPLCNELFPSNVFDMHMEVAHPTKPSASKSESLAARAAFLKKMPDKTVKCLTCKTLLSERSVFQHLLHGLSCLYCSSMFFSIRQLTEHIKQHNPSSKAYCDFLRQRYRVYSKSTGGILFPYFDVNTTAPREVLGDTEVNLALVTNSLDLIFFKLQPSSQPESCPAPVKISSANCPFCCEKFKHQSDHLQHLKQKHFVAPTIHAILKTEAFKCIYCNGVYTGKVTQQAVMLHIQRCRCSPKPPAPPPQPVQPLKPATAPQQILKPAQQQQQQPLLKPGQQLGQSHGLYFLQVPQGMTVAQALAPARVVPAARPVEPPETEAERQSQKRLEAALKEAMEANRREREQRAAMRKRQQEQERLFQERQLPPPEVEVPSDPSVKLALEPTVAERRGSEERKDFISKYFNRNPYATKAEMEELCRRLSVNKGEVSSLFSKKRSKCMKSLKRNTAVVLFGFNMTYLNNVKHNLLIPEQKPSTDTLDQTPADPTEPPAPPAEAAEPSRQIDESGADEASAPVDEEAEKLSGQKSGSEADRTAEPMDASGTEVSEPVTETKPDGNPEPLEEREAEVSERLGGNGEKDPEPMDEGGAGTLPEGDQAEPME